MTPAHAMLADVVWPWMPTLSAELRRSAEEMANLTDQDAYRLEPAYSIVNRAASLMRLAAGELEA